MLFKRFKTVLKRLDDIESSLSRQSAKIDIIAEKCSESNDILNEQVKAESPSNSGLVWFKRAAMLTIVLVELILLVLCIFYICEVYKGMYKCVWLDIITAMLSAIVLSISIMLSGSYIFSSRKGNLRDKVFWIAGVILMIQVFSYLGVVLWHGFKAYNDCSFKGIGAWLGYVLKQAHVERVYIYMVSAVGLLCELTVEKIKEMTKSGFINFMSIMIAVVSLIVPLFDMKN